MPKIEEQRKSLATLLKELEKGQEKMAAEGLTEAEGEALEQKAKEAEALQDELDRHARLQKLTGRAREIADSALPSGKREEEPTDAKAFGGYLSLGEAFVASPEYQEAKRRGFPGGVVHAGAQLDGYDLSRNVISLTKEQAAQYQAKAVPTIGSGVIDSQRLSEIVRATELDDLGFLNVLNTAPMTAGVVSWVRVTSYTEAAAPVAETGSAAKPEAAMVTAEVTTAPKTIAVWMPVTEAQLQDVPQVINEVNTHLMYDVRRELEDQCLYGSGAGEDFTGFFTDSGIVAGRSSASDTLIDKVKRAATDVRVSGYTPNAAVFHPYDWEAVVLSKGSDNRYVWVVVTEANGASRIWGLRATEAVGLAERGVLASEPERNVLVGDFQRGATLFMRQGITVQVGWNDDDFVKNKRTIRAELRARLAIKRPLAFRKIATHAASGAS